MKVVQQHSRVRSDWAVRVRTLSTQDGAAMGGSVAERLRALHELSTLCWQLAGNPLPSYERHAAPIRVVRALRTTAA